MKAHVDIWSDGSCSYNPGPGGYAALVVAGNSKAVVCGHSTSTTNNRMELMGFISGLQHAITISDEDIDATVYTDSKYICNAISFKWLDKWHKKSYVGIKNEDLWAILYDMLQYMDVEVIWVKGHSGDRNNDIADKFAVMARDEEVPANTVIAL